MNEVFFFDTYAFIEIIAGNPKYKRFEDSQIITTIFNLAELNYILKKEMSKEKADKYVQEYEKYIAEVTIEDIKNAMDLKIRDKQLSIPDVVGYTVAKRYNIKFLTGDQGFKDKMNVEFIKK